MDWKRRLLGISLAGGGLLACSSTTETTLPEAGAAPDSSTAADSAIPACNANPDPCCVAPDSPACLASRDAGPD